MTLTQLKYAITVSEAGSMNQAAKELFGEYGYAETTFKKISERAGVALGLLTHHYGNKEKLFLACGLDVLNRFQEKLEAATEATDFRRSWPSAARISSIPWIPPATGSCWCAAPPTRT